jgi:hypothetical protein
VDVAARRELVRVAGAMEERRFKFVKRLLMALSATLSLALVVFLEMHK